MQLQARLTQAQSRFASKAYLNYPETNRAITLLCDRVERELKLTKDEGGCLRRWAIRRYI